MAYKSFHKPWGAKRSQHCFAVMAQVLKDNLARVFPATLILPLFTLLVLGIMSSMVIPVYITYIRSAVVDSQPAVYCALNITAGTPGIGCPQYDIVTNSDPAQSKFTGLFLRARFTELNLPAELATMVLEVQALGDMVGDRGEIIIPTNTNLSVVVNSVSTDIMNGQQTVSHALLIPSTVIACNTWACCLGLLLAGDRAPRISADIDLRSSRALYQYPFDRYKALIGVKAFVSNTNVSFFVPVVMELQTSVPSFSLQVDNTDKEEKHVWVSGKSTVINTRVVLGRSLATKFFSVFIVVAMWVLSGSVFVYVVDLVYVRPHEIETDDAALVTGVMFSLPAVRAVQPGLPEAGASVDVLGYFWNMTLVVISAVLVLCGIVGQYIIEYRHRLHQQREPSTSSVVIDVDGTGAEAGYVAGTHKDIKMLPYNEDIILAS